MSPFIVTGVDWLIKRAGLWDGGGQLGRVDRWVVRAGRRRCRWCRSPCLVAETLHFLGTDETLAGHCLGCCP